MRIATTLCSLGLCSIASAICAAQANPAAAAPKPAATQTATAPLAGQAAPAAEAAPPSSLLKSALTTVDQTVTALKFDKWKRGTVRDEASKNSTAIEHDISANLPPLLAAADGAPDSLSKMLPVSRNVDALYDVLLRVSEASRVSAPPDQITALDQALTALQKGRLSLDSRMEEAASSMEQTVVGLQATVKKQAEFKCPAPPPTPVCTPPAPVHKPKKKVVPKPTTPGATGSTSKPATPAVSSNTTKPSNTAKPSASTPASTTAKPQN